MKHRPSVLVIAGHDPTGGAGIQADIESICHFNAHPCTLITALTVQNSSNLVHWQAVDTELITTQFETLIEDISFQAIKIGMLATVETVRTISTLLRQIPSVPVILDPVLSAGGGASLHTRQMIEALCHELLPLTELITPNTPEAQLLSGQKTPDDCASHLRQSGVKNMLLTGTHENGKNVVNRLYLQSGTKTETHWRRLPGSYHGSGCTLASAIAANIAHRKPLEESVRNALDYTYKTLEAADHPGHGQAFPVRIRIPSP